MGDPLKEKEMLKLFGMRTGVQINPQCLLNMYIK